MAKVGEVFSLNSSGFEAPNLHASISEGANGSSFDIFILLWRRKNSLLSIVFLVSLFSLLAAYQLQPRFEATALFKKAAANSDELILAWMWPKSAQSDFYIELEILQSDALLEKTVERLGLVDDPEFNGSFLPGWADNLASFSIFREFADIIRSPSDEKPEQGDAGADALGIATDKLRASLRASLEYVGSPSVSNIVVAPNVVAVTVQSIDPQKAAHIANTLVDIYISDYVERRFRAIAGTRATLLDRLNALRKAVVDSERAVAEFLSLRRLNANGRNALKDRQFAAVSAQLTMANAAYAEKKTQLDQLHKLRDSDQGIAAAKEVRASPLIQRLLDHEAALQRRIAELEPDFGERHPTMIKLHAELSAARGRMREEQIRIVHEFENELRVAGARVEALTRNLEQLDSERLVSTGDVVRLRQLQREAEANQYVFETYLARSEKAGLNGNAENENLIEIISPARTPAAPAYPRKGRIVGFGFIASLGLGLFLVVFLEALNTGFRSAEQIELMTGLPVLGTVPRLPGAEKDGRAPAKTILAEPESPYGEAIRSIRTGLTVSNVDMPPKIVLVASALPGEGKTSLSVSLARQSAISAVNGNVILIDCDLRRPAVSAVMGLRAEVGLAELFAGEASMDDVLKIDPNSGLHVLPCISGTPNAPDILNSRHMSDLLAHLSDSYDLVVIDSPALDSVSDARILAHLVDATVFVVQWSVTPRKKVIESLRHLASAGAKNAGIVIHRPDTEKMDQRAPIRQASSDISYDRHLAPGEPG